MRKRLRDLCLTATLVAVAACGRTENRVKGVVVDEDGVPVPAVKVQFFRADDAEAPLKSTHSGSDGRFLLGFLSTKGRVQHGNVVASKAGFEAFAAHYRAEESPEEVTIVLARASGEQP